MGYTTNFEGHLTFDKPLTAAHVSYIQTFSSTRRMGRSVPELQKLFEGKHGLNGDYGKQGEYFAKDDGQMGQSRDSSIIDHNKPPVTQPGLWCQWTVSDDGTILEWDGGEKFYCYIEWLKYMIKHFFAPWGYMLNGEITWEGEDSSDIGKIIVVDNEVNTKEGKIIYE